MSRKFAALSSYSSIAGLPCTTVDTPTHVRTCCDVFLTSKMSCRHFLQCLHDSYVQRSTYEYINSLGGKENLCCLGSIVSQYCLNNMI